MRLSISRKGMILVSVPLLLELFFIGILANALKRAEDLGRVENQSRRVITEAHSLFHTLFEAGFVEVKWRYAWKYAKDRKLLETFDPIIEKIPEQFERLRDLTKGNPRQEAHVTRMEPAVKNVSYLVTYFRQNVDAQDRIPMSDAVFAKVLNTNSQILLKELRALTDEEESVQDANVAAAERSTAAVKYLLVAGVCLNIVLAISLAFFFSQTITSRLSVLRDNSLRLASRAPLNEPVSGDDEISELDRVFHQMARALALSEEQKQEFVNMIGHDLRTPLAAIQGTLALVATGAYGSLSDVGNTRVDAAEKNINRLINLINELLEIERWHSGSMDIYPKNVELAPIIERAKTAVAALNESKDIRIRSEGRDFEVYADPDRLERVIINLLANAIKYSPKGSSVLISWERLSQYTQVEVKDEGRGIPAGAVDKVFDRFQQVERADALDQHSSGLGLAICKAIVEGHHGVIGVNSVEGKGSTFWFRLPHSKQDKDDPQVAS
jgi:signal transduction histidine kinase